MHLCISYYCRDARRPVCTIYHHSLVLVSNREEIDIDQVNIISSHHIILFAQDIRVGLTLVCISSSSSSTNANEISVY